MKHLIFIAFIAFTFSACNQAEIDRANREKDSLETIVLQRESSIDELLQSFNEVEQNLDSVAIKQHFIYLNVEKKGELRTSTKERINAEIANINALMEKNRMEIEELSKKMKKSGNRNAMLSKTIATLNQQLIQKNQELEDLNGRLLAANVQVAQLQTNVADLTEQNNQNAATISQTISALHTAYYVVGKSKDLKEAKIIDRKGGLLGIGKTSSLNADFDTSKFICIDYTQMSTIEINGKNAKLITSHPSNSYTLEKSYLDKDVVKSINITNPERFWSTSKYLVIVKD